MAIRMRWRRANNLRQSLNWYALPGLRLIGKQCFSAGQARRHTGAVQSVIVWSWQTVETPSLMSERLPPTGSPVLLLRILQDKPSAGILAYTGNST